MSEAQGPSSFAEVALRLPDGRVIPTWDGADAKAINAREHGGWGAIFIETLRVGPPRRISGE